MPINFKRIDVLRRGRSAHENHLIDGLLAGRVDRRDFLRHGALLGLSLPFLGSVAATVGLTAAPRKAHAQPGGTIRVAQNVPAGAIEPMTIADGGGITVLSQVAETWFCRARISSPIRCLPKAGRRTRTARSGPSSCARTSSSITARQ
jgi:peptide/nickel transport system substrate-binding protein